MLLTLDQNISSQRIQPQTHWLKNNPASAPSISTFFRSKALTPHHTVHYEMWRPSLMPPRIGLVPFPCWSSVNNTCGVWGPHSLLQYCLQPTGVPKVLWPHRTERHIHWQEEKMHKKQAADIPHWNARNRKLKIWEDIISQSMIWPVVSIACGVCFTGDECGLKIATGGLSLCRKLPADICVWLLQSHSLIYNQGAKCFLWRMSNLFVKFCFTSRQ